MVCDRGHIHEIVVGANEGCLYLPGLNVQMRTIFANSVQGILASPVDRDVPIEPEPLAHMAAIFDHFYQSHPRSRAHHEQSLQFPLDQVRYQRAYYELQDAELVSLSQTMRPKWNGEYVDKIKQSLARTGLHPEVTVGQERQEALLACVRKSLALTDRWDQIKQQYRDHTIAASLPEDISPRLLRELLDSVPEDLLERTRWLAGIHQRYGGTSVLRSEHIAPFLQLAEETPCAFGTIVPLMSDEQFDQFIDATLRFPNVDNWKKIATASAQRLTDDQVHRIVHDEQPMDDFFHEGQFAVRLPIYEALLDRIPQADFSVMCAKIYDPKYTPQSSGTAKGIAAFASRFSPDDTSTALHFLEHTDDVPSLRIHALGRLVPRLGREELVRAGTLLRAIDVDRKKDWYAQQTKQDIMRQIELRLNE